MFSRPKESDIQKAIDAYLEKQPSLALDSLTLQKSHAIVTLKADPAQGTALETQRQEIETLIKNIKGIKTASVILTAEHEEGQAPRTQAPIPDPHSMGKNPKLSLPNIKKIIAVASGKGGVGKSTVAANLACALATQGQKIGLLDADIYGPSIPRLMGLTDKGKPDMDDKKIQPYQAHGVKVMSMGFMVDPETAMIWRGPMVQSAIYQMLRDVDWGDLDILIVDMPPGTGDAQLTMAQKVPLTGAIIVSTPQDLALADAIKGIEMFRKVDVPILGLIENMSVFCCPNCNHKTPIFGQDGAKNKAYDLGVPYLGDLPLHPDIQIKGDAGQMTPEYFEKIIENFLQFN